VNFQQLRIVREAGRRNFNLTEVAAALFTSQSGVSKHIKDLEDELGIELFVRRGKRLLGLTDPGKELVAIVERLLLDAKNIKQLAEQYANRDQGRLVVATTHTQARYALPGVVAKFKSQFPKVRLVLHQSGPQEIVSMLQSGEADIGIATPGLDEHPELVAFPFYEWHHAVIAPAGHALASFKKPTLAQVAEFPIITYHEGLTGRSKVDEAFAAADIVPDIVMSALDADVIKTYVELGLGIGIVARMAFDAERDRNLQLVSCEHLFSSNVTRIAVRKGDYLRGFAYRFIELCSKDLNEAEIRTAISPYREE
jgi:LysR family cys regulon transcriptional activator